LPQPSATVNANKPATSAGGGSGAYEVARPRGQCVVCQAVIPPQQPLMAALRETPTGFERLDVCLNCWNDFDKADLIGFWKTSMPLVEQKKRLFVDDEVLCQLFERLADATEPAKLNFRFVLGLMLMRKRLIVYETSRNEGPSEIWQVRFKGREEILDLLNPRLEEAQILDVSNQLGEILNEEL
jgi:hypothetical protein